MGREIPLSRGLHMMVDEQDAALFVGTSWHAKPKKSSFGGWYACGKIDGKTVYAHRLIMGAKAGDVIDHINGDGLDNRRCNLRFATTSLNNVNKIYGPTATGFRGVAAHRRRFRAQVGSRSNHWFGPYRRTAEEAARDYDREAARRYGAFAILNFGELA